MHDDFAFSMLPVTKKIDSVVDEIINFCPGDLLFGVSHDEFSSDIWSIAACAGMR